MHFRQLGAIAGMMNDVWTDIQANIENPRGNSPLMGIGLVSGWAFAPGDSITQVLIAIDGTILEASMGKPRRCKSCLSGSAGEKRLYNAG